MLIYMLMLLEVLMYLIHSMMIDELMHLEMWIHQIYLMMIHELMHLDTPETFNDDPHVVILFRTSRPVIVPPPNPTYLVDNAWLCS